MHRSWSGVLTALAIPCLALAVVSAQQGGDRGGMPQGRGQQGPPAPTGPMAPEKYKDIQVLTDVPADQLDLTMRYFVAATGIQCSGCHARNQATGEIVYEQDSRGKSTARQMINLVKTVNAGDFGGRINCGTCHAGHNQPLGLQPAQMMTPDQAAQYLAQQAAMAARQGGAGRGGEEQRGGPPPAGAQGAQRGAPPQGGGQPGGRGPQTPAPPVDDVINKYIEGLGGQAALAKIQSRVITGTLTARTLQTMPFTIEEKGDKYREAVQAQTNPTTVGFDGTKGWMQTGTRVEDLEGFPLLLATRMSDLTLPLHLKDRYTTLTAGRPTRLAATTPGGTPIEVNLLQGSTPSRYETERLYFDASTGLLLRRQVITTTGLRGQLVEQYDYSDYRVVNEDAVRDHANRLEHERHAEGDVDQGERVDPGRDVREAQVAG